MGDNRFEIATALLREFEGLPKPMKEQLYDVFSETKNYLIDVGALRKMPCFSGFGYSKTLSYLESGGSDDIMINDQDGVLVSWVDPRKQEAKWFMRVDKGKS